MSAEPATANLDQPIRVLVVEDHVHVLWALRKLIEGEWPRMQLAGMASTVQEALAAIRRERPDVVLLDLYLGDDNSLDYLPQLLVAGGAAIVVLTGCKDAEMHQRALQGGARNVVLKDEPAELLLHEIQRAGQWRRSPQDLPARNQDCQPAVTTRIAGFVSLTTTRTEMKS